MPGCSGRNLTPFSGAIWSHTTAVQRDPPERFQLYDEPRWELNESVAYVDNIIREVDKEEGGRGTPGISPYNQDNEDAMEAYVKTVSPPEPLLDLYPILAGTPALTQRNAAAYERRLRPILETLAAGYGIAQRVTKKAEIPFWCIVQAHNHDNLREPTPKEIRVQVSLALAHGARGIYYYKYHSHIREKEGSRPRLEVYGLVDRSFQDRNGKLAEVRALNAKLKALAPTLLTLTSEDVLAGNAPDSFVQGLSDEADSDPRDFFLGTFTHKTSRSRYLMVVNQRIWDATSRSVTVTLDTKDLAGREYVYRVLDVYGKTRTPAPVSEDHADRVSFRVELAPGAGTLYRIEADRPGTVTLSSPAAEVRTPLSATLTDPDKRVRKTAWQRSKDGSTWTDISDATRDRYAPGPGDVGFRLRATVSYRDGASADDTDRRTAYSRPTDVVTGPTPLTVRYGSPRYELIESGHPFHAARLDEIRGAVEDPTQARQVRVFVQLTPAPGPGGGHSDHGDAGFPDRGGGLPGEGLAQGRRWERTSTAPTGWRGAFRPR